MRPKKRRDSGQIDLLRSRLDAIIDMGHPLVKLSRTIDWPFLEERFGAVYENKPGRPSQTIRQLVEFDALRRSFVGRFTLAPLVASARFKSASPPAACKSP